MKFAGRVNSLGFQSHETVLQIVESYKKVPGMTHLEFNYPEHFKDLDLKVLKEAIGTMKVNGVATRFKAPFVAGEFTNASEKVRRDAVQLCKDAIDACRYIGGDFLTVWQAYDGFDYPFQIDYERAWKLQIEAFQEICDYGKDLKISIEYKPFEPRSYALLDSIGTTLLAVKEINRTNIGVTLDFCHMLMKHDCPANALALAAKDGKLYGLHMNDGHGFMDNGLIFGTVNAAQALEFVYYLNKYKYDNVVFFDTFPVRENATEEIAANIEMFNSMNSAVNKVGLDKIEATLALQDGIASQKLILELLRNM